jgi:hypothetical protein
MNKDICQLAFVKVLSSKVKRIYVYGMQYHIFSQHPPLLSLLSLYLHVLVLIYMFPKRTQRLLAIEYAQPTNHTYLI